MQSVFGQSLLVHLTQPDGHPLNGQLLPRQLHWPHPGQTHEHEHAANALSALTSVPTLRPAKTADIPFTPRISACLLLTFLTTSSVSKLTCVSAPPMRM